MEFWGRVFQTVENGHQLLVDFANVLHIVKKFCVQLCTANNKKLRKIRVSCSPPISFFGLQLLKELFASIPLLCRIPHRYSAVLVADGLRMSTITPAQLEVEDAMGVELAEVDLPVVEMEAEVPAVAVAVVAGAV